MVRTNTASSSLWSTNLQETETGTEGGIPRLFLDISRGRTGYPSRPVVAGRFLIGSGPHCDLRLGGTSIPPLHSIIRTEEDAVRIEAQVAEPPLLINGERRRSAILAEGDRITLGVFEFVVRYSGRQTPPAGTSAFWREGASSSDETRSRLESEARESAKSMSAEEIVERIEQEQQEIDTDESGRAEGARSLLENVLARAAKLTGREIPRLEGFSSRGERRRSRISDDPYGSFEELPSRRFDLESQPVHELILQVQRLVERIESLTLRMEDRLDRFVAREERQQESLEEMNAAQERLLERLEAVVGRLHISNGNETPSVRVVA